MSAANFIKRSFCGVPKIDKPYEHQRNFFWFIASTDKARINKLNVMFGWKFCIMFSLLFENLTFFACLGEVWVG